VSGGDVSVLSRFRVKRKVFEAVALSTAKSCVANGVIAASFDMSGGVRAPCDARLAAVFALGKRLFRKSCVHKVVDNHPRLLRRAAPHLELIPDQSDFRADRSAVIDADASEHCLVRKPSAGLRCPARVEVASC